MICMPSSESQSKAAALYTLNICQNYFFFGSFTAAFHGGGEEEKAEGTENE